MAFREVGTPERTEWMIRKMHIFEAECDDCRRTEQFTAFSSKSVPEGWEIYSVDTCDMGCCSRDAVRCPTCAALAAPEDADGIS